MMNNTDLYTYIVDDLKLLIVSYFVSCFRRQVSIYCTASYLNDLTGSSLSSTPLLSLFFTNHPPKSTPVVLGEIRIRGHSTY